MRRSVHTSPVCLVLPEGRGRVRPTVIEEGYGAIELLDAEGEVVEAFVPERRRDQEK